MCNTTGLVSIQQGSVLGIIFLTVVVAEFRSCANFKNRWVEVFVRRAITVLCCC